MLWVRRVLDGERGETGCDSLKSPSYQSPPWGGHPNLDKDNILLDCSDYQ